MILTRHAGTVVEMLAGVVEVELLELELGARDNALGSLAFQHGLNCCPEVLELDTGRLVGDGEDDLGSAAHVELAIDHVDGGLPGAGEARRVLRGQILPVQGPYTHRISRRGKIAQ